MEWIEVRDEANARRAMARGEDGPTESHGGRRESGRSREGQARVGEGGRPAGSGVAGRAARGRRRVDLPSAPARRAAGAVPGTEGSIRSRPGQRPREIAPPHRRSEAGRPARRDTVHPSKGRCLLENAGPRRRLPRPASGSEGPGRLPRLASDGPDPGRSRRPREGPGRRHAPRRLIRGRPRRSRHRAPGRTPTSALASGPSTGEATQPTTTSRASIAFPGSPYSSITPRATRTPRPRGSGCGWHRMWPAFRQTSTPPGRGEWR